MHDQDGTLPASADLLQLTRLIHELCEMGSDAYAWRGRLYYVIAEMIGADVGTGYVMRLPLDPSAISSNVLLAFHYSLDETWLNFVEQGDLTSNPLTPGVMKRFGTDFTLRRDDLVEAATWYESPFYKEIAEPSGWDFSITSQVAVTPPGLVNGLGFMRAPGKPDFSERDVAIVRFVHEELARLWRRLDPIGTHALPERQREVLDGMRRGESRKAIADKLGISDHTVHTYEKTLFDKAGVSSRGELLASLAKHVQPNLLP